MSAALSATQLVLARAQRLSALDGLAAAAAHELGTPLGTISLVSKELMRGNMSEAEMKEDLALLNSQAERCKDILSRLSKRPDGTDVIYSRLHLLFLCMTEKTDLKKFDCVRNYDFYFHATQNEMMRQITRGSYSIDFFPGAKRSF